MKSLFRAATVVALVAAGLAACGKFGRNAISVANKNFTDEIEVRQNLVFTFDKNLAPDSLVDKWLEGQYIDFSPEVKGKYRWSAPNELVFSPEAGFRPSTDYRAALTDELVKLTKDVKLGDNAEFQFHTPYLAFVGSDVFWVMNQQNQPEVRVNLNFNYPVSPEEVGKLAKLSIDGNEAGFRVNGSEASPVVSVSVPAAASQAFDGKPLMVRMAPGLKTPGSDYTAKELQFESAVPDKNDFRISTVESEFDSDEPIVHVYTNQTVGGSADDVKRLISFTPAVSNFQVEMLEYGFKLTGGFASGNSYQLKINKNLKGVFGGTLKSDFENTVVFGQVAPMVQFTSSRAIYLTNRGQKNIGLRIVSIPKVMVKVYKVYQNNILAYLRESGELNSYYSEEDYYEGGYFYGDFDNYGDLVYEREMETSQLKRAEGAYLLNLNFPDNRPFKGMYVVQVQSTEDQWLRASKVVSLSDIGLIVKETPTEVLVFANSIMTAQPLANIDISLISSNNQDVYNLKTGANGVAKFADVKAKAPGFKVNMITASQGEDFNYLHFQQTAVNTSRYEVGGLRENESGFQAFLYGDRDLYRPDETMHLKAVVRDGAWNPVKDLPVKLRVALPNGKDFVNKRGVLSGQGTFETSVKLPTSTVTGTYTVELYTSNDVLLNAQNINVEEFVPDRIKVNTAIDNQVVNIGGKVNFSAQALNMYGPPARNRKWETELSLTRKEVFFKDLADYHFSLAGRTDLNFESKLMNGTTDEDGRFVASYDVPNTFQNIGVLEGKIYSTVFDESGRAVNRLNRFDVMTQPVLFGIKNFDYYVDVRQPISIPLVAVNSQGQVATNARGRVVVVRLEWQSVLERDTYSSSYRYVSQKKENVLLDKVINIASRSTTFPFVPTSAGEYEVRVMPEGSDGNAYVTRHFYAYSFGLAMNSSFEVNREGQVDMEFDQPTYQVGDQAKLLFKTPFKGRLLVTVERNQVLDHFVVETDQKTGSLTLPIKKEYLPNVYIAATLIKPMDQSSIPLTVAHGYKNLTVDSKSNKIDVKIQAPQNSRANAKQEIVVQTDRRESDIEVTLAVVDEGILILKNYQTPDPYGFFFQQRALQVNSYDLYPRLFPELKSLNRNYGADGYNLGKRLNPLANKRVKPLAFWSGTLRTDGQGQARYTVNLPQFSGDVRIMAVAVKDGAFGSASANMKVADPIVLTTALPLFLSPGDEINLPVNLSNTTAKNAEAQTKVTVSGAVELVAEASQAVGVAANAEQQAMFKIRAKDQIGTAQVKVEVNALGEKFTETIDLTVRPSTSLLKASGSGMADKPLNLDLARDYIASSVDGQLIVSRSPAVELAKELRYLLQYPYGCVEQTISVAFPQLYLADLLPGKTQGATMSLQAGATQNIQEAVRKLQTMQLYNGGLAYWQGGSEETWWGSVYGAHFLSEARKAGYDVDAKFLDNLLGYLANRVKKRSTEDYYYFDAANERKVRRIAPKESAYSLYVLATAGRPDNATMNYYKSNQQLLALDSKYLLATTFLLTGDRNSYQRLLPQNFNGERAETALGGSFYSYIRDEAIALNALIETDPQNGQIGIMARHLSQQLKQARYLNTQECAFGLLALGKLAKKANATTATATVAVDGKNVGTLNSAQPLALSREVAGKKVTITPQGGPVYYFWETEGLNASGTFKEEDNFLRVRRELYNRQGGRLSGSTFAQNDLIVVKLTLQSTGANVPNVVVTDMLPAGLEIENPRLSVIPGMDWIKGADTPEHFDFRDDRVNIFTTATAETKSYYYVVRAVTRGTFRQGPVSADAMYNGEYHSYHGAGTVTVQ